MTISEQKNEVRTSMRTVMKSQPQTYRTECGNRAAALLKTSQLFAQASSVFLFCGTPREIDTTPLITLCTATNKNVYLPRITATGNMEFAPLPLHPNEWHTGTFGIREPKNTIPAVTLTDVAAPVLILVPGCAFSGDGMRLGQGGGYYDRFLETLPQEQTTICGLCCSIQLIKTIPTEPHDRTMQYILTDSELRNIEENTK